MAGFNQRQLRIDGHRLGKLLCGEEWATYNLHADPYSQGAEWYHERMFLLLKVRRWFKKTGLAAEVAEAG